MLKNKAKKALGWDILGTFSTQGITFVVSIFLARLLEPAEFGLVGMAMVFIAISQTIVSMGFSSALIQRKEVSPLTYSSVFFVNMAIGVGIALLFYAGAPLVADFYEEPRVGPILKWLSLGIVISSFNIVQQTILQRELRFKELTIRKFIAAAVSGLAGVVLAFQGYGVYALVAQSLTASLVSTLLLWSISGWKPTLEFSMTEIKMLWSFGAYIFLSGILANVMKRVDVLIIGKLFSPATLGFFTRAESLNNLVGKYSATSLKSVFFPVLSQLQDNPTKFEAVFLRVLSVTSFIVFLLSGCLVLTGDFIVLTLFGEKWAPSIVIFQILMIKVFTYPINTMILSSFLAYGKSREIFWYNHVTRALRVGGWVVAWVYGFEAYLYGLIVIHLLSSIYYNLIVQHSLNISFKKQANAIYTFGVFFAVVVFPLFVLKNAFPVNLLTSLLLVLLFTSSFFALAFLFKKEFLKDLQKELSPIFNRMLKFKKAI